MADRGSNRVEPGMSADTHVPQDLLRLGRFVRDELRPFPGRLNVTLRCLLSSALVILTSMALQVPWLALSLIVVFYVTQSNVVLTRMLGMLFFVGSTIAIGTAILVLKFTYDYALLRILAASLMFFGSVYMMRVAKMGVVFFIIGISVIYVQTFVDLTDQAELLLRLVLWVWAAVNYAILVTLLINTLLLPAYPMEQLKAEAHRQLQTVAALLAVPPDSRSAPPRVGAPDAQRGTLALQKLLRFATMGNAEYRHHEAEHFACVTTVSRLYGAACHLPAPSPAWTECGSVDALRTACLELDEAIASGNPFVASAQLRETADEEAPSAVIEMRRALLAFSDRASSPMTEESLREKARLLSPDAFTNPVYVQFALKTSLAVLLSYVFYMATDWQGIHTIMLSCLIVAQPSLGATRLRSLLRVAGALVGSALALLMVVLLWAC
jgi:multidrug resistance protein MdtO